MPAKDLGTKHTCFKCSAKFYDLRKPDPVCPKCGADPREGPTLRAPVRSERRRAAKAPVAVEPEVGPEVSADLPADDEDAEAEAPDETAGDDDF
jgi:uncharacterized protein (TIGR02300 family)